MAKTLEDLIQRIAQLPEIVEKQLPTITYGFAGDAIALIWLRITKDGIPNARYSEKPMLVGESAFAIKSAFKPDIIGTELGRDANGKLVKGGVRKSNRSINKRSTKPRYRYIKFPNARFATKIMTLPHGYKQLRELNGRQTNHVDLEFTSVMRNNFTVLGINENTPLKPFAIVGVTTPENKEKLSGLHKKYGDFFTLSKDDANELEKEIRDKISIIIKGHILK